MDTGDIDHYHYKCKKILAACMGARDMLKEAAKQFKSTGQVAHANMCLRHAEQLNNFTPSCSHSDTERLDFLLHRLSGKVLREAGIIYSGGFQSMRDSIDAIIDVDR